MIASYDSMTYKFISESEKRPFLDRYGVSRQSLLTDYNKYNVNFFCYVFAPHNYM